MLLFKIDLRILKRIVCLGVLLSSYPCFSVTENYLNSIKDLTKDFLIRNVVAEPDESVEIDLSQLNELRIPRCNQPQITFPGNIKKEHITSVELVCSDTKPWHMLMPLNVQVLTRVVAAKKGITVKSTITEDDLDYVMRNKYRLYGNTFKDKDEVIGQVATHPLAPGSVLIARHVQQQILVKKNQPISLVLRKNSIVVSMQAIAKEDGLLKSTVKVYNPSSKKMFDAVVIGLNKAEIIS